MFSGPTRLAVAGLVAAVLALVTFAVYETVPPSDRADAAIDMTGKWNITITDATLAFWQCSADITQSGSGLDAYVVCQDNELNDPQYGWVDTGYLTKETGDFADFTWSDNTGEFFQLQGTTDGATMSGQGFHNGTITLTFTGSKKAIDTPTPTPTPKDTPTGPTPTPTSTPVPPDMEGKWNVSLTGLFNDQCSLNVTQSGTDLSGTADCVSAGVNPITNWSISNYPLIQLGFGSYGLAGMTDSVTMSGNWFSSSPPGSGTFTGTNKNPDTDGDGCKDAFEQQTAPGSETTGGNRDYTDPNDYYDVAVFGGVAGHDAVIDLANDILGVIQHYAPTGAAPYDVWFDRGPSAGPNAWNMTAPDGVIDLPNDVLGVILQFNHNCA